MRLEEGKAGKKDDLGVTIEAKFVVGEYQILILSATDSTGLDTWLKREKYTIPKDAEPLLRPYVESGMKWFVAKVDPAKVKWVGDGNDKRAALSPLRFHYDAEEFALPIRLGLANSSGTQDLIVNILAPNQRYEVTNYKNVTIPTNIDVDESMKDKFASFYGAVHHTVRSPAVITSTRGKRRAIHVRAPRSTIASSRRSAPTCSRVRGESRRRTRTPTSCSRACTRATARRSRMIFASRRRRRSSVAASTWSRTAGSKKARRRRASTTFKAAMRSAIAGVDR
jgi:hypothetical protein